jgi:hypothetical protein
MVTVIAQHPVAPAHLRERVQPELRRLVIVGTLMAEYLRLGLITPQGETPTPAEPRLDRDLPGMWDRALEGLRKAQAHTR